MADYNDYLKYLKHVDDTTAQDFKAREDALKKDISDLKAQFKDEKSKIETAYKKEISNLKASHNDEKAKMENMYNNNSSELKAQLKDKKTKLDKELKTKNSEILEKNNTINDLQSKLENMNYEIQCLRNCNTQNQEHRNQLMYVKVVCLCIGLIFSLFLFWRFPSLIGQIIAILLTVFFGYFIYKTINKNK